VILVAGVLGLVTNTERQKVMANEEKPKETKRKGWPIADRAKDMEAEQQRRQGTTPAKRRTIFGRKSK
jgi:hypothetical protein